MHSVRGRSRSATVRARVVASTLLLTAAALTVSGIVAERIQDREVVERVVEDLTRDAESLRMLVTAGSAPATGEDFASPSEALRASMERIVPEPHEGVVGFVDGRLAYVSEGAYVRLEDDEELLAAIAPLTTQRNPELVRVETPTTAYRVSVTQVTADAEGRVVMADDASASPGAPIAAEVLAYDEAAELARYQHAFTIYGWVALAAFLVVSAAAWVIAGHLLRPVRVLARAARSIGQEDLSERIPVSGNDDLAEMTSSVNAMLDRIESAFDSHTRLLDDVSHEMRTPITVVRGHLELMDPSDPVDAAEARRIGLDELDRMGMLVDDLLLLAKADRPDFVRTVDLDLSAYCDEVVSKASGLGERRWIRDPGSDGIVIADPHRLTQALLQLASNAVRYSDPGSEIGLGGSVAGATARVWVRDQGQGIPSEDLPLLFDRVGHSRSTEGLGLGLAIVSAIAVAHGGHVEVESTVGEGSVFTLVLPARAPSAEGASP